jgi:hypothetical protein
MPPLAPVNHIRNGLPFKAKKAGYLGCSKPKPAQCPYTLYDPFGEYCLRVFTSLSLASSNPSFDCSVFIILGAGAFE